MPKETDPELLARFAKVRAENPDMAVAELAERFRVTKSTVQSWARRLKLEATPRTPSSESAKRAAARRLKGEE